MQWAPQKLSAIKLYSFWHFPNIFLVWESKKTHRFMLGNIGKIGPEIDHFWRNFFNLPSPCHGHPKSWVPSNFILSDTFPIFSWCGKLKKQIDLCWGTWRKLDQKLTIFEEIFLTCRPCARGTPKVECHQTLFFLTFFPYFLGVGS